MIKYRRVVLRMNLSQSLMKICTFFFYIVKTSVLGVFFVSESPVKDIAHSCPYFLGSTVVIMVVVMDVHVVVVLVVVVVFVLLVIL